MPDWATETLDVAETLDGSGVSKVRERGGLSFHGCTPWFCGAGAVGWSSIIPRRTSGRMARFRTCTARYTLPRFRELGACPASLTPATPSRRTPCPRVLIVFRPPPSFVSIERSPSPIRCVRSLGAEIVLCPLACDTTPVEASPGYGHNEAITRTRAAENEVFIVVVNHANRFNGGSYCAGTLEAS